MEKIDLIYDHYKSTMSIIANAEKKRGLLFIYITLLELVNFLFLIYPNELVSSINNYITSQYDFEVNIGVMIIQSAMWIIIVYTMVRYYQTNIHIEKQYKYLHLLETKIGDNLSVTYFNRESGHYLDNFTTITNIFYNFYTWVIPILFILINIIKIYCEIKSQMPLSSLWFDIICCTFVSFLSILYLYMLHRKN